MQKDPLAVEKVQHPIKIRRLQVKQIQELSPNMRRISLSGDSLAGFLSASFDDHVKLLVPTSPEGELHLPVLGEQGLEFPADQPRPAMRDYTPRRYDPASNTLDIDFVLGHEGPATQWAMQATIGQELGIAGPRGSMIIPKGFDWHLLLGDETAIPAIARRLEELAPTTQAIVLIKIADSSHQIALAAQCQAHIQWVVDKNNDALPAILQALQLPEGEGYAWAAGEHSDIQVWRDILVNQLGIDKQRIRASNYWRK